MILSAWNEHDEGHWIAPALEKYGGAEKLVRRISSELTLRLYLRLRRATHRPPAANARQFQEAIKRAIDGVSARRADYWQAVGGQQ